MLRVIVASVLLAGLAAFAGERPRLGVVIVVDQLSAEAFNARQAKVTGGLKRLLTEGYVFHESRYEAAPTITSTGHATIVTGAYAEVHGIVSNEWIDGETGKPHLSTEDAAYRVVGREPQPRDGTAPTSLLAPTLADAVKLADDKALSLSISAKDRSAILCAGRAGMAVWFDAEKPFFTTSTFYAKELPAYVTPTNEKLAQLILKGAFQWGLPGGGTTGKSPQLPPASGRVGDSEPYAERKEIQATLDTAEVDIALEGVKVLGLGRDDVPDLLTISFSGHDRIGHEYGPDSQESLDEFLHVDRELGRLFTQLDALVGKGRWVAAFTSDHGVPPIPEVAQARGFDAGRLDMKKLREALDAELDAQLGRQDWFAGSKTPGLTLTPVLRAKALTQLAKLKKVAKAQPGVLDLLSPDELRGPWGSFFARGYFAGRSPDLIVITRPYWTYNSVDRTGHASAYLYDRAVPLAFLGAGVKKGQGGTAEQIHVAPTMSRLLGVPNPAAAQGRSLDEVLSR